jgi:hypothetical protein
MKGLAMRKLLFVLAAGVLGLTLVGTADARPRSHGHAPPAVRAKYHGHAVRAKYHGHAVRFKGGYYYVGHQDHWARRVWDAPHRRWLYFDGGLQVYFYWYAPGNCYYPVTYTP